MVHHVVASNRLQGIRIAPSVPMISNLYFADDTILFCRANVSDAEEVLSILNRYTRASGKIVNLEKSTMIFSPNTHNSTRDAIQSLLGIQHVTKFDKYLGLPTGIGRSKREVFAYSKDKLWVWMKGWMREIYLWLVKKC